MEYRFGKLTVACTHPERVMFPEAGITKGELVAYYNDIAEVMLPELRGRPLSVERYTKGVDQGGFFQKHAQKHYPTWLARAELGSKTRVSYPVVDNAAGLVYMANQGSVAFHVWTSRAATPEHPDQLVFDLDPPDGRFDLVRQVAVILRDLLEPLGLPAFVKTTGSKGLHVVSPLDGRATYEEVSALCLKIARLVCERHPDLCTLEFYKKDRKGRLFLDTMRNALGATVVAAYSVRGKPMAPVSTPIEWPEVDDPAMRPDGFTLRGLRARLDTVGDPWRDFRVSEGSIDSAEAEWSEIENL